MTPTTLERRAGAGRPPIAAGYVSVITPSLPGRARELAECIQSIAAQTVPVVHLIRADVDRVGPAVIRSELLDEARTDLVAFCDDDDLLDPDHVDTLTRAIDATGAELAWSWHRTTGESPARTPRPRGVAEAVAMMRAGRNVIPVTVVARRQAILDAGAFQPMDRFEDYALWLRMLDLGHRFAYVKRETWTYRFLGENRTWQR
jgi:glycosyltransferase involved in cell wall biosynthesis